MNNLKRIAESILKTLAVVVGMLISTDTFSQGTEQQMPASNSKKLLIGVNYSSDYCYRYLKNNNDSPEVNHYIDFNNEEESPKYGYTTGIVILYNLNKHISFESGIQFSNKGYKNNTGALRRPDEIDPMKGFVPPTPTSIVDSKIVYNHLYLDLPVRAIFSYGKKRVRFVSSLGVTTNILLKATQKSVFKYQNGNKERKTTNQPYTYQPINISPMISFGADYQVNNKLNLRVEPSFKYGLFKIIKNKPITAYLWNAGLNISCYYQLK